MSPSTHKYIKKTRDQLKKITPQILQRALERDGWLRKEEVGHTKGGVIVFEKGEKTVSVHYHTSGRGYGDKLRERIFERICWQEKDLKMLKLIK